MRCVTLLSLVAVAALLIVGCGGGSKSNSATPSQALEGSPVIETGSDYAVQGVDSAALCFDAAALPSSFVLDGESAYDNQGAAQLFLAGNPQQRAQDYQAWGRVTGYYRNWALSSLKAGARDEALAAPFFEAGCTVDLYNDARGAHQAFVAIAHDLINSSGTPGIDVVEMDTAFHLQLGGETVALVTHFIGGAGSSYQVLFRAHNVIGRVDAFSGRSGPAVGPAQDLARALVDRLQIQLKPNGFGRGKK